MKKINKKGQNIKAILGPTNTGKTFYAMDRMLSHKTGMIGFPLRLLARENYEKAIILAGNENVALVTGEEKIIPDQAKYFCCTVESMPIERRVCFLCVDEIQLASDKDRGHIFTDRLLNARGSEETVFLGSEIIKTLIEKLLPNCKIETRPRLSKLSYSGIKKITRLEEKSAIVTFSIPEIYRIADTVRSLKGGAAVVMGALSPKTRNSQVDMFQNNQVDYIVATDAIGMGLNLNINHVAFAATAKFDGKRMENLQTNEIAQIAGRAGRSSKNGTFGVIDNNLKFEKSVVESIENHNFPLIKHIWWRNSNLNFNSVQCLVHSLEMSSPSIHLKKKGNALDLITLINFSKLDYIKKIRISDNDVKLLWDICQIPDFVNSFSDKYFNLLKKLFQILLDRRLSNDWINNQIKIFDKYDGEIDSLLNRIANIRTWTYITNKSNWIEEAEYWQTKTKSIEDKLSDVLHERLTKKFVDKKMTMLTKKMNEKTPLTTSVKFDGKVFVEEQEVGQLKSFKFIPIISKSDQTRKLLTVARKALSDEISRRIKDFLSSSENSIKINFDGVVLWMGDAIGKLAKGKEIYYPTFILDDLEMLSIDQKRIIEKKTNEFIKKQIFSIFKDAILLKTTNLDLSITKNIKAITFQVYEGVGCAITENLPFEINKLTLQEKKVLANLGIRLGVKSIYSPNLIKPNAINLKAILWLIFHKLSTNNIIFNEGRVKLKLDKNMPIDFYKFIGFKTFKTFCLRVDIFEKLLVQIRTISKKSPFKMNSSMLSIAGATILEMLEILESQNFVVKQKKSSENPKIDDYLFGKKRNLKKFFSTKIDKSFKSKQNINSPFSVLKSLKIHK